MQNGFDGSGEANKQKRTNPFLFSLYIGFFAGLIWGGVKIVEYKLKFTTVVPGFLLGGVMEHAYLETWQGMLAGWASFIVLSMAAALLYGFLLRHRTGPWYGFAYGIVWWGLLYLLVGPFYKMMPAVQLLDRTTFYADLCLFVLWGLFIGYSISMEFTNERSREPA